MKILYNTGTEFKESKESAENLAVKIVDDNGDIVEETVQELVSNDHQGIKRLIGAEDINDNHRSVREIARNELAKQLIPEDARESLDTLKEIADWIQDHPESASQMNSRIDTLEEAVPFVLYIQNGVYGYKKENGDFIPFKSQADIDAAVTAAKVGTATAADVLAGKTFTNSTTSGVTGTMVDHDAATNAVSVGTNNTNTCHRIPTGAYLKLQGTGYPEIVTPLTEYGDAAAENVLSGKKFTSSAGLKATGSMENLSTNNRYQHYSNNSTPTILGDAGFFTTVYDKISKANLGDYFEIRYNGSPNKNASNNATSNGYLQTNTLIALPSETRSVTPSTSAQTISPNSNKVIKSVTVDAIPTQRNASGQASGDKVWLYNNRIYFGFDYGWYPSGSTFGSMSNVCERYVNYSSVVGTLGITASTVRPGSTILGVAGTKESTTYTCPSNWTGSPSTGGNGDMGDTNTYRFVNAANVYNKGKSDGKSEAWTFKASYENKTALTFSVTSGYYIVVTQLGQTSYCTISTSGASVTVVTEIKALKIYKATSTGNLSLNGNGKNLNILVYCGIS